MIGKHIKNRGVKQKSALRHPVFSYSMGDTLISPIVASYLLYLAVTYTLIRTYLDKPDNLHFNGDYRKKLDCSHYYLGIFMYDWTNNILYAKYPLGKPKKTDTPFRERMPAFLPSFVLQRCKDTEKFKIFKSLSLYIRNVTHISQYSQNHRWTCQISWWFVLLEHGCWEINVRIFLLPLHHYRKLWISL